MKDSASIPDHAWRFFRAGGFDQVRLDSGPDLIALDRLDQKLWVSLACPTTGLHFDALTLALIDTDNDGRVRPPELIAAVKWAGRLLKSPDILLQGSSALALADINASIPEGKALLDLARQTLASLGKGEATSISVDDAMDTGKIFAQAPFNGDGVVVEESTNDPALRSVLREIIESVGPETDRSGRPGVSQAGLDRFAEQAHAFSEWHRKAEEDGKVLALGAGTAAAAAAVSAVKAKADDYFARCRLAAFDPRAQSALNREEKEFLALAAKELTVASPDIAALPLARIEADRPLPFDGRANPAWETAILRLRDDAVRPLLGEKSALTEEEWREMQARLAPWFAWEKERPATQVERLGLARVREILEGRALAGIADLIARDRAEEAKANAITDVERLVRFNRDLHSLCTNFVNFKDFYDGAEPAIFQAGRLYLDQRSCDLCLHVADAGRHAGMAGLAGAFLAYCDCVRDGGREKMQIVAAFTDGDSDNLMVGRNGIFYDRQGRDWDATITMIVDNPISMRQAFWLPYKKLVRMIESQVAKRAASAEAASHERLEKAADAVASVDRRPAPPPPPKRIDVGTVAAIGVAVTGAVSALTLILGYVFQLRPSRLPLVVLGLMFLISGPSLLIAWLKLRRRNLGPILDANGWAVNSPAKINVPFGATLTSLAKLPPGARRDLRDPFAEKRSSWPAIVVLALLLWIAYSLLDHRGLIHKWTDGWIGTKVEQSVIEVE